MSEDGNPGTPADAAADWLARRQAGEDLATDPAFQAWLAAGAHRAAWERALALWDSFDEEPDPLLAGMRKAALAARPARRGRRAGWWAIASVAAAAAVVLIVRIDRSGMPGGAPSEDRPLATLAFATTDARRDVTLPDGSRLALDRDTALTASLYATHRDVRLARGQAYFAVAHDAARPFTLRAMGGSVTDIGTEFDAATRPQGMQVVLVRGAVAVADGTRRLQLAPGESYDTSPGARTIEHPDITALLAWREGYLEFSNETLGQAVAAMNRYAAHPIVLKDRAIASLPSVTGRFKAGDTAQFAEALADIYSLKLTHLPGGGIALTR